MINKLVNEYVSLKKAYTNIASALFIEQLSWCSKDVRQEYHSEALDKVLELYRLPVYSVEDKLALYVCTLILEATSK